MIEKSFGGLTKWFIHRVDGKQRWGR